MTHFLDLSLGNSQSESNDNEESEGSASPYDKEVSVYDEEVADEVTSASTTLDEVCEVESVR